MQEKKLMYKEQMIQHKLELAQLNAGQAPPAMGANYTPIGFGQDFSSDSFVFSTDMMSSILPPLPSTSWDSGASALLP